MPTAQEFDGYELFKNLPPSILVGVNPVTRILAAIESGDPHATAQLPRLAALRLAQEKPGQTLEPTTLVHEAYLRLIGNDEKRQWDGRNHFFAAAAESMRRILIDNVRRNGTEMGDVARS